MLVSDIFEEFKAVMGGPCDTASVLSRMTQAYQSLMNASKASWQLNVGTVDICICDGTVTMPPFVGTVLALNQAGIPTFGRSYWFEHSYNGPGSTNETPLGFRDYLGDYPIFREPSFAFKLVLDGVASSDGNKRFRVWGTDTNDTPIYTKDANGVTMEGFYVPTVPGKRVANSNVPLLKRITRIVSDPLSSPVVLFAVNPDDNTAIPVGQYLPGDTEPRWKRFRVAGNGWLRVKYRRVNGPLRSMYDWIPIENSAALLMAGKFITSMLDKNEVDLASRYLNAAVSLLSDEAYARADPADDGIQFDNRAPVEAGENLLYGGYNQWGGN